MQIEDPENWIQKMSQQLQTAIMPFVKESRAEIKNHIEQLIKTTLQQNGWVTREMFDVQQALLTRTRQKLDHLEKILLAYLEQNEMEKNG